MKIISGGQTGADRGGLDAGRILGLRVGGWCPRGRRAEDGTIPNKYPLVETTSANYSDRTRENIMGADATIIFVYGTVSGGSEATARICDLLGKPHLIVNLSDAVAWDEIVRDWLGMVKPEVLNVAGSRESKAPGIQKTVRDILVMAIGGRSE
jgi:hypothetical protein